MFSATDITMETVGVLLSTVWSARPQQEGEDWSAPERGFSLQRPNPGNYSYLLACFKTVNYA